MPQAGDVNGSGARAPASSAAAAEAASDPATALASPSSHPAATTPTRDKEGEQDNARRVKYFVRPDGVTVEVEGVSFVPAAEFVRDGTGWAIRIRVEARSKDGSRHSVLAPKDAEIALAGEIQRVAGGEHESFTDRRAGEREVAVQGSKPVVLTRTWPAGGHPKALAVGDEVSLRLGLWGVGADLALGRALHKFCKLTVKVDPAKTRKGSIVIEPPEGADGAAPSAGR